MPRYVILTWNLINESQRGAARSMVQRRCSSPPWRSVYASKSVEVLCADADVRVLHDNGIVIFGSLFERAQPNDPTPPPRARIDSQQGLRINETEGRALFKNYEGCGVAVIHRAESAATYVLRDPTGYVPCYQTSHQGVRVYFSHIEDCLAFGCRFTVNKHYLAAHLVNPTLTVSETGLNEVREVIGGECDAVRGDHVSSSFYWHPSHFIAELIEDPQEAIRRLRDAVLANVRKHADRPTVGHLFSGGVDSSIVLSALRDMLDRPRIVCLTQYSDFHMGDERAFAKSMIETVPGCDWFTFPVNMEASFSVMLSATLTPRPGNYSVCFNERQIMQEARTRRVPVLFNGVAGDGLFFSNKAGAAVDYWLLHGEHPSLQRVVQDEARLRNISEEDVVHDMRREKEERARWNPFARSLEHSQLLSTDVIDLATRDYQQHIHPWLRPLDSLPPGKRTHINMLCTMCRPVSMTRFLSEPGDPEEISPIMSESIMEVCLSIPTYLHTLGGQTRAIARTAFANELSQLVRKRRTKGDPRGYSAAVLRAPRNREFANDYLPNGRLVDEGFVDQPTLRVATAGMPSKVLPSRVIDLLSCEVWYRRWEDLARQAVAV